MLHLDAREAGSPSDLERRQEHGGQLPFALAAATVRIVDDLDAGPTSDHRVFTRATSNDDILFAANWRGDVSGDAQAAADIWWRSLYNVLAEDGRAAPVADAEFTASIFSLLGVQPRLGRPLIEADEAIGAPDVVVIRYGLWQPRLAGDSDVVGRTIGVGAVPRTVVGVMPPGFQYPIRDQLWMPVRFSWLIRVSPADHGSAVPGSPSVDPGTGLGLSSRPSSLATRSRSCPAS